MYETRVSTAPFRNCDHTNLGVSGLCDFENDGMKNVLKPYLEAFGLIIMHEKIALENSLKS